MLSCNTGNYLIKRQSERYIVMLIKHDDMITDDKTLAKTFNEHYINTVERSSGLKPEKMKFENSLNTSRNILQCYRSLQESSQYP